VSRGPKIAVVIPAYNEESSIGDVVGEVNRVALSHQLNLRVVVVNDCSTDDTAGVLQTLSCTALHLPINLGIGGAVQTGIKYALRKGFDMAVQIDGDGQHPPSAIPVLVEAMEANCLDVVIGSRFIDKQGFQSTRMRRSGIAFFRFLNRRLCGVDITDNTSGFRLLNRKAMIVVDEYYPDEYPEPEAIVLFAKNGFRIGEVPVVMRERQGGVSSIGALSSVYYMVKVTLAVIFTHIRIKKK
jgi:glycosyltransferase involved in cell wall biosynthesis